MAITIAVRSFIMDSVSATDTDIATALNADTTYTTIYGVSIVPISNVKSRIVVVYA